MGIINKSIQLLGKNRTFFLEGKEMGMIQKFKLKLAKRYRPMTIRFAKKKLHISDSSSFVSNYKEIFLDQVYTFNSNSKIPLILDCGSNIGLSILYFKQQYPKAKIIAFEPDKEIFKQLSTNCKTFQLEDVTLNNKAIWIDDKPLQFSAEGDLSGHITDKPTDKTIQVEACRLKDLLNEPIDLLKIDIEGAELAVLNDCKDKLSQVQHIFIEYHSFRGEEQKLQDLLSIINEAGFRYHIQEAFTSPTPFIEVNTQTNMDLQLNIFGIR